MAQLVKNPPAMWETWVRSLGWEDPPEKGTATHSSVLAWRFPGTGEPGGLLSMGLHRATAWECSPGRSLCLTKSSACGRLWQFASGLHSRLTRRVRPRLEGKPRTPLSSRVATRVSWSPLSGLKGAPQLLAFSPGKEQAAGVWETCLAPAPDPASFPQGQAHRPCPCFLPSSAPHTWDTSAPAMGVVPRAQSEPLLMGTNSFSTFL